MRLDPESTRRRPRRLRRPWPGFASRASLILTVACAAPLAPVHGQIRGPEVREVRFEGNATFPGDSLERAIVTQETDCRSFFLQPLCWLGVDFALRRAPLRERELELDRARLTIWYQRRGFLDVRVDSPSVARGPTEVEVLFQIDEGRPVLANTITFEGPIDPVDSGLREGLPLAPGDRLSALTRDATRDTLVQRLRNRGYAHADVYFRAFRPNEDPYNAQVTFDVQPGPLTTYGVIDIQGLEELSAGTIRRTLQFNEGDLYSDSDIANAQARLFGLDIVRSAQVVPDLQSSVDSIVPVSVLVQEADAYRVRAGGGMSTAECLNVETRWTSRNFLGGGRLLQVRGRMGNLLASDFGDLLCTDSGEGDYADLTWVAAVDLSQPWIFSSRYSLTASIFAERQTLPDIFIRRAIGFQAALTRSIDRNTLMTLFYRPERSELDADDVLFCTGFLVCTPSDIALLEGANWLAPIGVRLTRDRSDDLLNPRSGSRLTLDVEHAAGWTGSNYRYDRAVAEATWYESLGGAFVAATRLRGGWVGAGAFDALARRGEDVSIVHPQRRFYAGGASSVRGFAQARLGPRVLVTQDVEGLLNSEADGGAGCTPQELMDLSCDAGVADSEVVTLFERPTGGTRVVEGNAEIRFPLASWLEGVAFTDFGQAWGSGEGIELEDIEFTPGVGVRFPSPVGPIRIDVAYRPRGVQALSVIARQIRPYDPMSDLESDQLIIGGMTIPFVTTSQLALLGPTVPFLENEGRVQLHVSIGQAF